jgi:[CysO sulfur-carrier protein]-S-L-cysteine hydrolase
LRELQLPAQVVDEMVQHCLLGRPNEACGLLAGRGVRATKVFPMANAAASPVRYALDPAEQLRVYRELEAQGLELCGVFHSHTHTEAYPSPTDVRLASEDVPYVIVSLSETPPVVRAFRISKAFWADETGDIQELRVRFEG